jgi:membrane associated rhomboid family serine protease
MNRNPSSFLFFLLCCLVSQSVAQYTFQQRPWQRKARGRPSSSTSYRSTTAQSPPTAVHDYRSHYLDYDDWATDKKTRLWDVRLNSRRPNQMSWTSRLVIANVAMYALQVWKPSVTQLGVKLSDRILRGEELYRLISPVFLHGSIFHLFSNMYSLRNVGQTTEQMFGPGRYLAGYLVAGAAGNLLSAMQSPNPALGASGAVFGVMVSRPSGQKLLRCQRDSYFDFIMYSRLVSMSF